MTQEDKWHGCYEGGWQGLIVPEAFAHPAKFAYKLTERMIGHAIAEGWLSKGFIIVDPFGGIGCGGIVAAYCDIQWIGVELEQKFVDLAEQNFKLHDAKWRRLNCPRPVIIQGDSRKLSQILSEADCIVASPPYAESIGNEKSGIDWSKQADRQTAHSHGYDGEGYGCAPGQLGAMKPGSIDAVIASPPYAEQQEGGGIAKSIAGKSDYPLNAAGQRVKKANNAGHVLGYQGQGQTPGNLGNLKPGSIDCVLSSPPYTETLKGDGTQAETAAESRAKRRTEGGSLGQSQRTQGYGSVGNLGNLKPGSVDAVVSSPPYVSGGHHPDQTGAWGGKAQANTKDIAGYGQSPGQLGQMPPGQIDCVLSSPPFSEDHPRQVKLREKWCKGGGNGFLKAQGFAKTDGNIAKEQGETFWHAARIIVEQCYQILKPGGHAIWVVKDFVRNKKRVDFTSDWRRLYEAVGFETLHVHHAMLTQVDEKDSLFGHKIVRKKERKSFFRRLAESKGSPTIDYEVVLCMQKALFE